MTIIAHSTPATLPAATAQTWLLRAAVVTTLFGILHHLDHAIRGNHIGWPLTNQVNPFTYSLAIYPFIVLGYYLTRRGRAGAGYWLTVALVGFGLVASTHFGPQAVEPLYDIYTPWADPLFYCTIAPPERVSFFRDVYAPVASPFFAVVAVAILVSLVAALLMLAITALRVRLATGRW